jgi:hypothetical protein
VLGCSVFIQHLRCANGESSEGKDIVAVVGKDSKNVRGVLRSDEVEVQTGNQFSRDVILTLVPQEGVLEFRETAALEPGLPQVPRRV